MQRARLIRVALLPFAAAWLAFPRILFSTEDADKPPGTEKAPIDGATLDAWSAPYRNWHYWPDHVIPAQPRVPGFEQFVNTDVPCVYQMPDDDRFYMSFIAFGGLFYDFYNAANGGIEQTGLATSADLITWQRDAGNPIIRNRSGGYDEQFCSDPKVFRDGDHWTMFYFGVGRGGAHIMIAFSRDLRSWTAHPDPLYKAGGHPAGLDRQYAHKISLVYHRPRDTFFMYYCACGEKGRGVGLLTSKPAVPPDPRLP